MAAPKKTTGTSKKTTTPKKPASVAPLTPRAAKKPKPTAKPAAQSALAGQNTQLLIVIFTALCLTFALITAVKYL